MTSPSAIRRLLLPVAFLLSMPAFAFFTGSPRLEVRFDDDPVAYQVSAAWQDSVLYASLEEFADLLGFNRYTNVQNRKTVLRIGSHTIKATAHSPFVMVDDAVFQMVLPIRELEDKPFVPVALFLEALDGVFPFRFDWSPKTATLRLAKIRYSLTGFNVESKGNGMLIRIRSTKPFSPSDIATSVGGGWIHITVYGGTLDTLRVKSEEIPGVLKKAVSYQFDDSAQLSFQFGREIVDKTVTAQENAILVSVWTSDKIPGAEVAPSEQTKTRWLIDTIVIDPGHGGRDPGAIGPTSVKEKKVTLEIGLRLRDLLRKTLPGTKIVMTRESDVYVGLKDRTKFANTSGGKLFMSIHTNANRSRSVRGFSTYLLGVGKAQQAVEVAQMENSVVRYEDAPEAYEEFQDFDYIINAIALNSYLKESTQLATLINDSLKRGIKLQDQGVHQQGLWVLIGASMPSVLVETCFISNPHEERLLKTNAFQQKVAEALCASVIQFKEKSEQEIQ
jgi:N-acetylmuramoyl-L-alanine amidase